MLLLLGFYSKTEARFLQAKIGPSHQADSCSTSSRSLKRQRSSTSPGEELPAAKAKRPDRDWNLAACTSHVSLSPVSSSSSSSCSPVQQDELSHDLLIEAHGCTDQLLSSPAGSPSYFPYPEAALTCHLSASTLAGADQTFEQAAFGMLGDLASPSSPPCYFQACSPDAPLVPDRLSVSDVCDISLDCALHQEDFSSLEQPQEGSEAQAHQVPQRAFPALSGLLTPSQSPSSEESDRYDEREQVEISILAQQISSLASSFTKRRALGALQPSWSTHRPLHRANADLTLDDGVIDLILDDLGKSSYACQQSIPDVLLPAPHQDGLDTFSLQMGHHHWSSGLHQPSRHLQGGLPPGKRPDPLQPFTQSAPHSDIFVFFPFRAIC